METSGSKTLSSIKECIRRRSIILSSDLAFLKTVVTHSPHQHVLDKLLSLGKHELRLL